MKTVFSLLACLICAVAAAQPIERGPGRGLGPGREAREGEDFRQRRERMQAFREEIRQQRETQRLQPERRIERDAERVEPPRGLRRLSPEARQRLREEMRDAYRR